MDKKETIKRDKGLDIVKGLASILMIFAHAHGYGKTTDNWLTLSIYHIGLFAPVLFLSSVGVSLTYQVKKKSNFIIVVGYVLLFIVSFANMGLRLRYKEYFTLADWNLYASISLSAILTLFILDYVNLFVAFIPIILLFILNKTNIGISLFYGGLFSIIPWTSFTLIGLYLHSHKYFIKVLFVLTLMMSSLLIITNKHGVFDEYNTPFYLTFGLLIYSFSLIITPKLLKIKYISNLLIYLGQNSLLFYMTHRLIVIYLPLKLFAPVLWLILFITTIIFMYIFTKINNLYIRKYSDNYFFWALLIIVLFIPSLISMNIYLQRAIMFGILILHALNYRNFMNLSIFKKNYNNER